MSRGYATGLFKEITLISLSTNTFTALNPRKGLAWIPAKARNACRRMNKKPDPPLSAGYAIMGEWLISEWLIGLKLLEEG
jgi:hypothetical protein